MSELKLYTDQELATILKVHPGTLRNWRIQKKIPFTRIGGAVRYTEAQVREIMQPVQAAAEATR